MRPGPHFLYRRSGALPPYHVGCDLFRRVPVQVKFKGDHFVIVRFQSALHHLVARVAHLQCQGSACGGYCGEEDTRLAEDVLGGGKRTLSMLSFGLPIFSWRERVRVDLRWCLRIRAWPLAACVPSQPSLSSFPDAASEVTLTGKDDNCNWELFTFVIRTHVLHSPSLIEGNGSDIGVGGGLKKTKVAAWYRRIWQTEKNRGWYLSWLCPPACFSTDWSYGREKNQQKAEVNSHKRDSSPRVTSGTVEQHQRFQWKVPIFSESPRKLSKTVCVVHFDVHACQNSVPVEMYGAE